MTDLDPVIAPRPRRLPIVLAACLAVLAGGCGGVAGVATSAPTRAAPPDPSSPPPASTPSPADVEEWRTFRETLGLRADDAWILAVAANPAGQAGLEQFGIPLLAFEVSDLMARTRAYHDAGPVILDYAATVPDDWYGSYIDQQRGGVIVAQFFRNTDHHREALARLLPLSARWEVRQVDQRTLDTIAFVARVKADRAWFATIDAELLDVVTNPMDGGIVELTYIAASRDLDPVIRDHYGAPEWLRVERAGGPPWTGPVGDLVVQAVDADRRPVADLICSLGGNSAMLTGRDGTCRYDGLAAVSYTVEIWAGIEESTHTVGSADVTVSPVGTTSIRIVVTEP